MDFGEGGERALTEMSSASGEKIRQVVLIGAPLGPHERLKS